MDILSAHLIIFENRGNIWNIKIIWKIIVCHRVGSMSLASRKSLCVTSCDTCERFMEAGGPPCALWLAACRDGTVLAPSPGSRGRGRQLLCFPTTPSVFDALRHPSDAGFGQACLAKATTSRPCLDAWDCWGVPRGFRGSGFPVCGLLRVAPHAVFDSSSSIMDDSFLAQFMYHRCPNDSYSLDVCEALQVVDLQDMAYKQSRQQGSGGLAKATAAKPLFRGSWGVTAGTAEAAASRVALSTHRRVISRSSVEAARSTITAAEALLLWGIAGWSK